MDRYEKSALVVRSVTAASAAAVGAGIGALVYSDDRSKGAGIGALVAGSFGLIFPQTVMFLGVLLTGRGQRS